VARFIKTVCVMYDKEIYEVFFTVKKKSAKTSARKAVKAKAAPRSKNSGKLVVITGATGKLGSVVAPLFVKNGFFVRAIVRSEYKARKLYARELKEKTVELLQADLQDASAANVTKLSRACSGASAVVHLAALVDATAPRKELYSANVAATKTILEAARRGKAGKFVLCSSTAVYGTPRSAPASESALFSPIYAYGESKIKAEEAVRNGGMPFVILRPGVIYGPAMRGQFTALLKAISLGKAKIIGRGDNLLPFVHERDVARAFLLAVQNKGVVGDFIIVDPRQLTQREALHLVARHLGVPAPTRHVNVVLAKLFAMVHVLVSTLRGKKSSFTPELVELTAAHRHFSVEKAKRVLGWQPREKVSKALGEMVGAWKKQGGV